MLLNRLFRFSAKHLSSGSIMKEVQKIGTHDGAFHCDEVLACAMLKHLPQFKDAEIVRTRDQSKLDQCDIVVDVGGTYDPAKHRYDHHQKTFNESMSSLVPGMRYTTKLSSAGLVYVHFGKELLAHIMSKSKEDPVVDKIYDKVYEKLMEEVDAVDNGIPTHDGEARYSVTTTLGSRVANLRPAWNDKDQDFDKGFEKAMALVWPEFQDRVDFYLEEWWPAREVVVKALDNRFNVHKSGRILEFDHGGCPYREHLYNLEEEQKIEGHMLFVLFKDTNGLWRVGTVGVKDVAFKSRLDLKQEWRGLRNQELEEKSGIPGATFVHMGGFTGGNKTRDGALRMAVESMEAAGIQ